MTMNDNTKPADFSRYTTAELITAALFARNLQWERTDLLNLLEQMGNVMDLMFAQNIRQTELLSGLRKDLSKF